MTEEELSRRENELLKLLFRKSRLQLDIKETELEMSRLKSELSPESFQKVQVVFNKQVLEIMKAQTGKEPQIRKRGNQIEITY